MEKEGGRCDYETGKMCEYAKKKKKKRGATKTGEVRSGPPGGGRGAGAFIFGDVSELLLRNGLSFTKMVVIRGGRKKSHYSSVIRRDTAEDRASMDSCSKYSLLCLIYTYR